MMNRDKVKQMRAFLEVALTGFEEHFGVAINLGTFRFDETNAKVPLEISVVSEGGEVITKEHENFKRYAASYGLRPEWLGKEFSSNGYTFAVTGLSTRAKKYNVLAKRSDGQGFKFAPDRVKLLMEMAK
jgi:hypothetical protein